MKPETKAYQSAPEWTDFPDIELYMDQVISVLEKHLSPYYTEEKGVTPTMINNYVKQSLVPPPKGKRYDRGQVSRLFMICVLKSFMQLSDIASLLDRLALDRDEEALYALFSREMDAALSAVYGESVSAPSPADPTENVLHAALMAFASILYAGGVYRKAAAGWKDAPEQKKAEKKKEKKEKK